jgi:hypothetical protein
MGYYSRLAGGAEMESGPTSVTQQEVPGEDFEVGRQLEPEHEDDGAGNNNPAKHEESEF